MLGETGDQVETDIREPQITKDRHPLIDIGCAMPASCGLEFVVNEGLHAETDAIDARRRPVSGLFGLDRFGVGFERDLVERARKGIADSLKYFTQQARLKKARRAAADVDGVDGQARGQRNPRCSEERRVTTNFPTNRFDIRRKAASRHHAGMEVTVGALRLAEGYLDVDA